MPDILAKAIDRLACRKYFSFPGDESRLRTDVDDDDYGDDDDDTPSSAS